MNVWPTGGGREQRISFPHRRAALMLSPLGSMVPSTEELLEGLLRREVRAEPSLGAEQEGLAVLGTTLFSNTEKRELKDPSRW